MRIAASSGSKRDKGVDLAARRQRAAQHDRQSPTVKALCHDFIERHAKPHKRTWVQDQRMLDKDVIPAWGRLKAEGITRADVVTLLDRISDRGSPMQAGKVLALVRKVWNFGIDRGALKPGIRPRAFPASKGQRRRPRACDSELRYVLLKLANAAMRPQVAAAIQLQAVDWLTNWRSPASRMVRKSTPAERTWLIPASKSKNRREHLVPLSPQAFAVDRRPAACEIPGSYSRPREVIAPSAGEVVRKGMSWPKRCRI